VAQARRSKFASQLLANRWKKIPRLAVIRAFNFRWNYYKVMKGGLTRSSVVEDSSRFQINLVEFQRTLGLSLMRVKNPRAGEQQEHNIEIKNESDFY
jgi:hypothetical protein